MKKYLNLLIIIVVITLGIYYLFLVYKKQCELLTQKNNYTELVVINSSYKDSVKVFVTLQSTDSVLGLFGITDTISSSKGWFYAQREVMYPSNRNASLQGVVISFEGDNLPCQVAIPQGFKNGINIFECSINVPYEVFDISCEDGVNCIIKASVTDTFWNTGDGSSLKRFKTTRNKLEIGNNLNIRGVFPYRCTDCIDLGTAVPQNCFNLPDTCNTDRICQVERTKHNGGSIIVQYCGSDN